MAVDLGPLPDDGASPSVLAARQAARARTRRPDTLRAYALGPASRDPETLRVELGATQALLRADSALEVGAIVSTLVHDLGAALVPARYADPAAVVPLDVSLGQSEPLLPFVDPVSVAAVRLGAVLPEFLEAARLVIARLQGERQRAEEATQDDLTGVLTRRAWMRRLSRAAPGDGICLIGVDHPSTTHDTVGHAAGDAVLRAIGGLLLRTFRADDSCGRYGADELVCLTAGGPGRSLVSTCDELRHAWERERPTAAAGVGLSIGAAEVGADGGQVTLRSADRAMRTARTEGRDRTVLASPDTHGPGRPS